MKLPKEFWVRPTKVSAMQWDGINTEDIAHWIGTVQGQLTRTTNYYFGELTGLLHLYPKQHSPIVLALTDWVVRIDTNVWRVVKAAEFKAKYTGRPPKGQ